MATKKAAQATATEDAAIFKPYLRYKTISYIEADAPEGALPFEITMRSDLSIEEVEELRLAPDSQTTNAELWDLMAPHVVKWPFHDHKTGDPLPAPAVGGGAMFRKAPAGLANLIYIDLMKLNIGHVDPKP